MIEQKTPVVPPRNNLKKQPLFVKASVADVEGREPGFTYKWVEERDANHPQHVSRFMTRQRVGNEEVGYATAEPWQLCSVKDAEATGRKRDDQGKPIDTLVRHGSLVLVRTPDENAAVYEEFDRLKNDLRARRLRQGDFDAIPGDNGGRATFKARVASDFAGDHRDLLNQPQQGE